MYSLQKFFEDLLRDRKKLLVLGLILVGIAIFVASRFQFLRHEFQLNPDESHMMALALRLRADWIPWRSVNAGTSGPLNPGLLALAQTVGLPNTYAVVHGIAISLMLGTFLFGWRIARRMTDRVSAVVAFLACTLWMASTIEADFTHYASELLPSFLIAAGLAVLVDKRGHCSLNPRLIFIGCFIVCLSPWAKLQAAPIALCVCFWAAASIYFRSDEECPFPKRHLLIELAAFASLLPMIVLLAICYAKGTLEDLWATYYTANISYAGGKTFALFLTHCTKLFKMPWNHGLAAFMVITLIFAPEYLLRKADRFKLLLCGSLLLVSLASVLQPLYDWPHYQITMLLPIELCVALCIYFIRQSLQESSLKLQVRTMAACITICFGVPLVMSINANAHLREVLAQNPAASSNAQDVLKQRVLPIVPQGESLFVWGWSPSLYIDLKAQPATRNADYFYLVRESPAREFMRDRCMQDLYTSKPNWIIAPDLGIWFAKGSIKPFPKLQQLLDSSYKIVYRDELMIIYQKKI